MLSGQQLHLFHTNGYLPLRGMIPADLLKRLADLFDEQMMPGNDTDKVVIENKGQQFVTNLEKLCCKGNLTCLELLGFPAIPETAKAICGDDFFLVQEFAVIKHRGDDLPVRWHQDMVHQRTGHCFTMGIYLDNAAQRDGALRVVPGSHLSGKPICELSKEDYTEVPMQAGDVLIHDMMLAHCSEPIRKNKMRRVIYFEFLSAAHVYNENIYSNELVERRTRLTNAAIQYYHTLHPSAKTFGYLPRERFEEDKHLPLQDILEEIYSKPVNARPSAYCHEEASIFSAF